MSAGLFLVILSVVLALLLGFVLWLAAHGDAPRNDNGVTK